MRPKPMKPHVAHAEAVDEKVLRADEELDPVRPPFPNRHSLEGEKRMETAARMAVAVPRITMYVENRR